MDAAYEATTRAEGMSAFDRYRVLLKTAELLKQNSSFMAQLISKNVGNPIAEAETSRAVTTLTFAAEEAKRIYGK